MSDTDDLFDEMPKQPENATKPEPKKRTRKKPSTSTEARKKSAESGKAKTTRTRSSSATGTRKKSTSTASRKTSSASKKGDTAPGKSVSRTTKAPAPSLEESRVRKSTISSSLPKKTLPQDIPDMSNLTLSERIHALSADKVQIDAEADREEKEREKLEAIRSSVKKSARPVLQEKDIPDVGHRQKSEDRSRLFSALLLLVILLLVILLCTLVAIRSGVLERDSDTEADSGAALDEAVIDDGVLLLEIRSGMSAGQVARSLEGIVDEKEFLDYLKEHDLATRLLVGSYRVPVGISVESLASAITQKSSQGSVNIYDGYTLSEIDSMLTNRGLIKGGEFLSAVKRVASERGLGFEEGYFLSGVYSWNGPYELAVAMQDSLMELLGENSEAILALDLSLDDVVKIASMVNRETKDRAQMALISGIILNRYQSGMPLGIDATTRYELGNWSGSIGHGVFEKDTPYNTRRRPGLPPTGIGCPGRDAVLSVLHPVRTDDMYYLHDGEGRLYTSQTYEEHLDTYDKVY